VLQSIELPITCIMHSLLGAHYLHYAFTSWCPLLASCIHFLVPITCIMHSFPGVCLMLVLWLVVA